MSRARSIARYFAYGSNMSRAQMQERCPGSRLVGSARLAGYRLGFTRHSPRWGAGVADVVPDPSSEVWGLLYDVTDMHIAELDAREGHPHHYVRMPVDVRGAEGVVVAWTYGVVSKVDFVAPSRRYHEIMLAAAREHAFPGEYVARLAAFDAVDV